MMKILVKRLHYTNNSIISEMSIDGNFECYVLEDIERDFKIKGKTAINKGTYRVVITMSNRFKIELPLLLNVPKFEGIRIHAGNTAKDTEGCLLLGKTRGLDYIGNSRLAMKGFMVKLRQGLKQEKVYLTIE